MTGRPSFAPAALRAAILMLLLLLAGGGAAMSEPKPSYPALTGRIVDDADVIPADIQARIEPRLKELEVKSGIQLVVATVKSLNGDDVENYANELFRRWKLGEAKNNNGVLLLVAPQDRKVRIEVGYGLEGTLTDAATSLIIANDIVPRFKAKDYGGGIERGVDDLVKTLSADAGEWAKRPRPAPRHEDSSFIAEALPILIFAGIFLIIVFAQGRSGGRSGYRRGSDTTFFPIPTGSSNRGSDSGGFSGGDSDAFSGGGGSSGGGGASGSW